MPTLTLYFDDKDYADVLRVLSAREGVMRVAGGPMPTNGELFASVCREWEAREAAGGSPNCPACGSGPVERHPQGSFVCTACGKDIPVTEFVPLQMFVGPAVFALVQEMRKKSGARDVAEASAVAWSIYNALLDADRAGGRVFVQAGISDKVMRRVELYPHVKNRR